MRQLIEKHCAGDGQNDGILTKMPECAKRIGALPFEFPPVFHRVRFRKEEPPIDEIHRSERRDGEKRRPMPEFISDKPAERRADYETEPERRAHQPEIRGALFGRRYVGDIRIGGGESRSERSCKDSRDKENGEGRRRRHQEKIHRICRKRAEYDRAPTKPV
jgi:hypothetical protein